MNKTQAYIFTLFTYVIGIAAMAYVAVKYLPLFGLWLMVCIYCMGILSFILQIIFHELGHLIFGLLSGYTFVSIRFGSWMLMKENDKYIIKKFKLYGTGGQCILMPKDDTESYKLYHLGGVINNGIVSFLALFGLLVPHPYIQAFSSILAIVGLISILTNGIPIKEPTNNDGYNVVQMKDTKIRKVILDTQRIYAYMTQGMSLKDMDKKLFWMPSDEDLKSNTLFVAQALMKESYLMVNHQFDEAYDLCQKLIVVDDIASQFKLAVQVELVYLSLLLDKEGVEEIIHDKMFQKLSKQMNTNLSVIRSLYAHYLMHDEEDIALQYRSQFTKLKDSYPYLGDYYDEQTLMELIKSKKEGKYVD